MQTAVCKREIATFSFLSAKTQVRGGGLPNVTSEDTISGRRQPSWANTAGPGGLTAALDHTATVEGTVLTELRKIQSEMFQPCMPTNCVSIEEIGKYR